MILLKKLEEFKTKKFSKIRLGLFECPKCKKLVKKTIGNGIRAQTCGCFDYSIITIKHNLSKHPLYFCWKNMLNRCYNTTVEKYVENYQKRGIIVCNEWKDDLLSFYNWAINNGFKKGLQIDRKNNDKGYYPDNCRFVTCKENLLNRRSYKNKII